MLDNPPSEEIVRFSPQAEVLRDPSDEDFAALQDILPKAFSSISTENLTEYVPRLIAADSADMIVARTPEGNIASVLVVNIDFGAGKLRGRIDDVATSETHLRQGYGGVALDHALKWFKDRGVKRVALTSNGDRQPAHRLYESRSFKVKETNQFQLDLYIDSRNRF